MVIAECKTEEVGGEGGGRHVTAGVTCPQISHILIPLGFPVPPTPSEDKSKAALAYEVGRLRSVHAGGLCPTLLQR